MPTGYYYTKPIHEGLEFKDFVMWCARETGKLVEPYYQEEVKQLKQEKEELAAISAEEAEEKATAEYDKALSSRQRKINDSRDRKRRYDAMLAQVRAWCPPTPDHEGLKKFMIGQITESIKWDGQEERWISMPKRLDGESWRSARLLSIEGYYKFNRNACREEAERLAEQNLWVAELQESLK